MPRLQPPPEGARYSNNDEIVYEEIPLEARRWMSAIRMFVGNEQSFDYGCEAAWRLVASLYEYLEVRERQFPKTWWDAWKLSYQSRKWYKFLNRGLKLSEPEMVTFEARAVFPEIHAFEDHTTIKYMVHRKAG